VRRLSWAITVSLLIISASGLPALIVGEPCSGYEQRGTEHGACPPTCVTCGCCVQAAEPMAFPIATSDQIPVVEIDAALVTALPKTDPREILHVPKLRFA
jgi:hypothetical protein